MADVSCCERHASDAARLRPRASHDLSVAATPTRMPVMSIRRRYYAYTYAYAPRPTGRDRWRMRG